MSINVIVFDFDGTLVDSNQLKYDAFFKLFPDDPKYSAIIREALAEFPEKSRFFVLREMLLRLGELPPYLLEEKASGLAGKYNRIVVEAVKHCPEKTGAREMLERLGGSRRLYLSSVTPRDSLAEILRFRDMEKFFVAFFGYPDHKNETLEKIIRLESIDPTQVLVVGDGNSDRRSAEHAGCHFYQVNESAPLNKLESYLDELDEQKQ